MTLQELITDLKAAGANENTIRLATNSYVMGMVNEREACAKVCDMEAERIDKSHEAMLEPEDEPIPFMVGKSVTASRLARNIRARGLQ